jgi:hypothetical protein
MSPPGDIMASGLALRRSRKTNYSDSPFSSTNYPVLPFFQPTTEARQAGVAVVTIMDIVVV